MKKVQKREDRETKKQSIEENKNPSYRDILLERRKTVMSKLGIEQDFLTDIVSINYKVKRVIIYSLFLIIIACSEKKQQLSDTEKVLHFDVEEFSNIDINNFNGEKYEEHASKSIKPPIASYIPLQTTSECLIGEITKLIYTDQYIYIWDVISNKLYQFDTTGQFMRQIGQMGEGPNRYVKICAFDVNKENGNISIYCERKTSIIEYNCNGEIVKVEKTGLVISDFAYYKDHYLFYCNRFYNEPIFKKTYPIQYRLVSFRNNVINEQYLEYKYRDYLSNTVYSSNRIGFYMLNEYLMLVEPQTNIIYKIEQNKVVPVYALDFGKYNMPFDIFSTEISNKEIDALSSANLCRLFNFYETDDLIYIRCSINDPLFSSIYLKKTGEVINLGFWWMNINDNIAMPTIVAATNDALIGYYDADTFCFIVKRDRDKVSGYLIELANNIKEDDNPIICIAKF
jgi:hypothetical protein